MLVLNNFFANIAFELANVLWHITGSAELISAMLAVKRFAVGNFVQCAALLFRELARLLSEQMVI